RGPRRVRWDRVAAFVLFFLFVALPGVAVYRIQTDKGEIVIQPLDDDVEVVVKQGGKVVKIYDPKSGQKLVLWSGTYELELNGKPSGLKLDIVSVTLKRGDKPIVKIERVNPPPPGPLKPASEKPGEVWRSTEHVGNVLGVDFSHDGNKVLSSSSDGSVRL